MKTIVNKVTDADNKGQQSVHSLLDALSKNDTNKTVSSRNFLKGEAVKDQKTFNTIKDDLQLTRERNAYQRQNWLKNDGNGEKAAKLKRESDAKLVEQAQKVPHIVMQECLRMIGLPVNTKLGELENSELIQIIGCLQGKYTVVEEYAKDRYCAMNLRSAIEGVRLRCVSSHTEDEKKQNALGSTLGTIWKDREKTLCSVLVNLSSVMKSVHNPKDETCVKKAEQNFKTAVKRLHELDLFFPIEMPRFYEDALTEEIEFLNKIENKDESSIWELWKEKHKDFWLTKATVWQSEKDLNHRGDTLIVQKLVKNIIVEKTSIKTSATLEELAYVKAIVRANVEGLQLSTQAEQCLWITTVHPKSFFSRVVEEMSKNSEEWKKLDETEKHLQFCAALGNFYNTLSVVDPHHDAPSLPSFCPVGSTDYRRYVERISLASPELRTVGSALIKLTVQEKLFETTVKPE